MSDHNSVIAYFDGLVEPYNPGGYACAGWSFISPSDEYSEEGGYYIGIGTEWADPSAQFLLSHPARTTNNIAEYLAAIECLRKIWRLPWRGPVQLYGDSKVVVEQYNERWACNSPNLQRLLKHLRVAAKHFELVDMIWIPREENITADQEARRVYREVTGRDAPDRRRKTPRRG